MEMEMDNSTPKPEQSKEACDNKLEEQAPINKDGHSDVIMQDFSFLRCVLEHGRIAEVEALSGNANWTTMKKPPGDHDGKACPGNNSGTSIGFTLWDIQVGLAKVAGAQSGSSHKCPLCKLTFPTFEEMQNHCIEKHLKNKMKCRVCRRTFCHWQELRTHEMTHHVHHCKWCEKTFLVKSSYVAHIRQHTGERPYGCASCQKRYTNLPGLYYHLKKFPSHKSLPYRKGPSNKEKKTEEEELVNNASNANAQDDGGLEPMDLEPCTSSNMSVDPESESDSEPLNLTF